MTRGTHAAVDLPPTVGDAVGRYRIVGVIGDGSLGRLYLAEQRAARGISRIVALRQIRQELALNARFRARFLDIARVAAHCEHPNLVSIFELADVDGCCFISREYLPGESLAAILGRANASEGVSPDIAAYVVKLAANALQSLHDLRQSSAQWRGAEHDEIQPANVWVTYHGTVKWLAFGLRSLIHEASSGGTDAKSQSPPSRSAGSSRSSTALDADSARRADVFHLGALLWTCLAGERPVSLHASADDVAASSGVSRSQHAAVAKREHAGVPEALRAIAQRALAPNPQDRFESPRAMADELERYFSTRESRPTPKHLRRWMSQLFDADRAWLQTQVAHGREVEAALSHLSAGPPTSGAAKASLSLAGPQPRELWSTSDAMFAQLSRTRSIPPGSFQRVVSAAPEQARVTAVPSSRLGAIPSGAASAGAPAKPRPMPSQERAARSRVAVALVAGGALALGALVMAFTARKSSTPDELVDSAGPAARGGGVHVQSVPEGAAVFIDGEPTGLQTPATLKGLSSGRTLRVRVDKAGFASQEQQIEVVGGTVVTGTFELGASTGRLQLIGAPPDARIYIDEAQIVVEGNAPLSLALGRHTVRVETPGGLLFSRTIEVTAGEQTLQVGGELGR